VGRFVLNCVGTVQEKEGRMAPAAPTYTNRSKETKKYDDENKERITFIEGEG
jgi:hypothetical protein